MQADADLLAAYRARRCEEAFAAIHARHGAMVLRTCLRSLGDVQEAEDAAQAAFLMLAQRPEAVQGSLAAWLYYAARKTAFVAHRSRKRRVHREETVAAMQAKFLPGADGGLREEIDAALERLSEPLREAVILCHLEGRDQLDAARQAGCSQATISRRSTEGLNQLRDILARRGLPVGAVLLAGFLTREATAAVPLAPLTAGQLLGGAGSAQPALLAKAAWQAMFWAKFQVKLAALTVCLLTAGIAGLALALWQESPPVRAAVIDTRTPLVRERAIFDHSDRVICVAFSPDGKTLASGGADKRVQLYDARTGQLLAVLDRHRFALKCVAFSADGATLASADVPGNVVLWNVADGKPRTAFRVSGPVYSLAFAPDGSTLSLTLARGNVELWDPASGQRRHVLQGHTDLVFSQAYTPDGRTLATGSRDRTVRLWDVTTGRERFRLIGPGRPIGAVAFAPDGRTVVAGSGRALDEVWGARTVVHSPENAAALTFWNVSTGEQTASVNVDVPGIYSLAFAPGGELLALGSGDATVRLWDAKGKCELATLRGHEALVRSLVFAPDGKTLASASHDLTVRLWDVQARNKASRERERPE